MDGKHIFFIIAGVIALVTGAKKGSGSCGINCYVCYGHSSNKECGDTTIHCGETFQACQTIVNKSVIEKHCAHPKDCWGQALQGCKGDKCAYCCDVDKCNNDIPATNKNIAAMKDKYPPAAKSHYKNPPAANSPHKNPSATNNPYKNPPAANSPHQNPPTANKNPPAAHIPYKNPPAANNPHKNPSAANNPYKNPPTTNNPYKNSPAANNPHKNPPAANSPHQNPPTTNNPYKNPPAANSPHQTPPTANKNPPAAHIPYKNPPAGYQAESIKTSDTSQSCIPNPCQNGGTCNKIDSGGVRPRSRSRTSRSVKLKKFVADTVIEKLQRNDRSVSSLPIQWQSKSTRAITDTLGIEQTLDNLEHTLDNLAAGEYRRKSGSRTRSESLSRTSTQLSTDNKDFICHCPDSYWGPLCEEGSFPLGQTYNCAARNPCNGDVIDKDHLAWSHDDPFKYVQCDRGHCLLMECPPGLIWNQSKQGCIWTGADIDRP